MLLLTFTTLQFFESTNGARADIECTYIIEVW